MKHNKIAGKIVLPINNGKDGILIHNNMLFVIKRNKIKVCTINEPLSSAEKQALGKNLEEGLNLIDKKIQKGPYFSFDKGDEIFFHDCYFFQKENNTVSCYLLF